MYNPENVPPVESTVSTKFDTFDEDQQVEENPDDEDASNVAGNKFFDENPEDGEVLDNEEIPNVEENPMVEENPLDAEQESEEINVDTFVAEILAKAQAESSASLLKRQKMMARKKVPSWYPLRPSSKVVPLPIKRRSSRIKSKITSDPNYELEMVNLSNNDEGNTDLVVPSVTTKGKKVFLKPLKSLLLNPHQKKVQRRLYLR